MTEPVRRRLSIDLLVGTQNFASPLGSPIGDSCSRLGKDEYPFTNWYESHEDAIPDTMTVARVGSCTALTMLEKHKKSCTLLFLVIPENASPIANMIPDKAAPKDLEESTAEELPTGRVIAKSVKIPVTPALANGEDIGMRSVRRKSVEADHDLIGAMRYRVKTEVAVKVHVATKLRKLKREIPHIPVGGCNLEAAGRVD